MTAPWSGSEEADGEEELAEGVGSADAVSSAVGDAEGAGALGVVAAGLGTLLTVACWRDSAVAAAHPRAAWGGACRRACLRRCGQIHPWGTENSRVQTIGKEGVGRGWRAGNVAWPVRH